MHSLRIYSTEMEGKNCWRVVVVAAGTVTMAVVGEIYSNTDLFQITRYYSMRVHIKTNAFRRVEGAQKPFQNKKPSLIELHITSHLFENNIDVALFPWRTN